MLLYMFLLSEEKELEADTFCCPHVVHLTKQQSLNHSGSVTQAGHFTLRTTYIMTAMLLNNKKKNMRKMYIFFIFLFIKG